VRQVTDDNLSMDFDLRRPTRRRDFGILFRARMWRNSSHCPEKVDKGHMHVMSRRYVAHPAVAMHDVRSGRRENASARSLNVYSFWISMTLPKRPRL
jgi:hypothetical protein